MVYFLIMWWWCYLIITVRLPPYILSFLLEKFYTFCCHLLLLLYSPTSNTEGYVTLESWTHSAPTMTVVEIARDSFPTQLIARDGEFNAEGFRNFVDSVKLHECGLSYAVVAIMGPQSSGASLLSWFFFSFLLAGWWDFR